MGRDWLEKQQNLGMQAMEKTFNAAEAEARISKRWIERKVGAAGANAVPGAEAFW